MRFAEGSVREIPQRISLGSAVASVLCVLLAGQPVTTHASTKKKAVSPPIKQVEGDQRILHALNRLTFGARPGDVAAIRAMGLDRWIEEQLNPESIDDSALEARLAAFPAMKLTQAELMHR